MQTDTLVYNTENIRELADNLKHYLGDFESQIEGMFGVIEGTLNSSEYWQGKAYEEFKNYCTNYRNNEIKPLIEQINTWISNFNQAAAEADDTTARNVGLFS